VEFLRGLKSALTQGAGHPPYTDTHAQQVNVGGQDLNVTGLGGAQDSPQVREEITSRMNRMNVQQANALAGNVGASGLPQDFKDLVGGINSLRQAVQQAGSLSAMGTTRAAADAAIQNIATTVGQQISKGMRGGMDPRRAVYDVLAASPQTERQHLLEAIQKGLSESEKVAQIGGHDADGAQLLEFYRQASDNGKIKDQSKLLVNWAGKLSEAHASPAEIRKGWQFIQAYNGVKPPEEAQGRGRRGGGRRGSQRDRRFEAEEE
jgi:hypothetical protein